MSEWQGLDWVFYPLGAVTAFGGLVYICAVLWRWALSQVIISKGMTKAFMKTWADQQRKYPKA